MAQQNAAYVPEDQRIVAALLAFFLGAFGVHKFYLGRTKQGLLFFLLCWTGIPAIIALIDTILILVKGKQLF